MINTDPFLYPQILQNESNFVCNCILAINSLTMFIFSHHNIIIPLKDFESFKTFFKQVDHNISFIPVAYIKNETDIEKPFRDCIFNHINILVGKTKTVQEIKNEFERTFYESNFWMELTGLDINNDIDINLSIWNSFIKYINLSSEVILSSVNIFEKKEKALDLLEYKINDQKNIIERLESKIRDLQSNLN